MENDAYRKDLEEQNIHFPDVKSPRKIYYQLDTELETLYDKTIMYLSDKINGLKYYRYQAIKYLKSPKKSKYKKGRYDFYPIGRHYEDAACQANR